MQVVTTKSVTPPVQHLEHADAGRLALGAHRQAENLTPITGELLTEQLPEVTDCEAVKADRPKRGRVTGWSRRSRLRMMYRLATLDWLSVNGVMEMVTLTYPREFPQDGAVCKGHLWALLKRWERKWGSRPQGCWKMEFQQRGAPHFHLYVGRPTVAVEEFRRWLSDAWFEVVHGVDAQVVRDLVELHGRPRTAELLGLTVSQVCHLWAGTGLDRQFVSRARSAKAVAWYFSKHNAHKSVQNEVPEGFANVGRFWGVLGLRPQTHEVRLTTQEFVDVRRALVRFRRAALRSRGVKVKARGRLQGMWALVDDPDRMATQLLALVRGDGRGVNVEGPPTEVEGPVTMGLLRV